MFKLANGKENLSLKASRTKAQQENITTNNIYYRQMANIAINNFKWDNLPNGLLSRRFEQMLFKYGVGAFFYNDKIDTFCVLPVANNGQLDIYSEPIAWTVTGYNYSNQGLNIENSVLIRNNYFCVPSQQDVIFYSQKIAKIQRTIDVQLEQIKTPYIIKSNDRKLLSMRNILSKKEDGELAIFIDEGLSIDNFNLFPTPTNYVIDKLTAHKSSVESEFLKLYGFDNVDMEKGERLVVAELEKNEEVTNNGYMSVMLEMRKEACDLINEMFGLNISVSLNREEQEFEEDFEEDFEEGEEDV